MASRTTQPTSLTRKTTTGAIRPDPAHQVQAAERASPATYCMIFGSARPPLMTGTVRPLRAHPARSGRRCGAILMTQTTGLQRLEQARSFGQSISAQTTSRSTLTRAKSLGLLSSRAITS